MSTERGADTAVQPATILVVDDNAMNRALAESTLEDEGYRVVLASSGAEGLEAFEREHPDCVLLDVRMPGLDGFAVCERLRALPGGRDTPVIFLTALRDVDTFDQAIAAGANDFLTKPVRPTELVARVTTVLELRRMGSELRAQYELHKRQRDALVRLQLQKERLTAFVVHDLKNPVNALDLHAQLLLREPGLSANARDSVAQIRAEARQLTRMIMNLLDVSKADEGKLTARRNAVDLGLLVRAVATELGASATSRQVTLESAFEALVVQADADLLSRTVANLVDNAIRYSPTGGTVTISSRRTDRTTEIRVADTGHGVPPSLRAQIFDPFVQVDAGAQLVSRTSRGLGLSFCKSAIEAHDGRIWIEDASPGAAFCVSIPHA